MNCKYTLALFALCVTGYTAHAQFNETIRTGRPGQAIGPYSVGRSVFQTQTGFDAGGSANNSSDANSHYILPNTVFRFGITKHFELNTSLSYSNNRYNLHDSSYSTNGLSTATVGTRINLYEGKNSIPAVGLQIVFKLPVLSHDYNPKYIAPRILFIAGQKLTDKVSYVINIGPEWNGNDAKPTGVYVANLTYSFSPKWGTFLENYGSFTNNHFENRWDTGLAWLVNENLQLDAYGGVGDNYGTTDYFGSVGISWRVVTARQSSLQSLAK